MYHQINNSNYGHRLRHVGRPGEECIRLSIRYGAGGLCRMEDVVPVSDRLHDYRITQISSTHSHMIDRHESGSRYPRSGILNYLSHLFTPGCFDDGNEHNRLTTLVTDRRSPLVRDFIHNWKTLRQELSGPDVDEIDIPDRCPFKVSIQYTSRRDNSIRVKDFQGSQ